MDKQEAKLVLQSLRPNDPGDAKTVFAEALALVGTDPELRAWWDAQQEFDRKVTAKLLEIPIPDDLRDACMAERKIERMTPTPSYSFWLAAAAAVAIFCAAGAVRHYYDFGPEPREDYTASVLPLLNHDSPDLAITSGDREKLMAWLKDQQAPMGTLPDKMNALSTLGCQKYEVHGHTVTLICFAMDGGGIAHLFMVNRDALINPPPNGHPDFDKVEGWSTAAWSDGRMNYLLATQAGDEALAKLL